jgi:Cu+-exporting ATPase
MDAPVSIGVLAAFAWSLWALLFGTAGEPGMTHPFELTIAPSDGAGNIYLEVAAGVTTFILAGRRFEAQAKRRSGAALHALLELGAKDVTVRRGPAEVRPRADPRPADRRQRRRGRHGGRRGGHRHRHRRGAAHRQGGRGPRAAGPGQGRRHDG